MAEPNAILRRVGLAGILAIGTGVVAALAVHWCVLIGEQLFGQQPIHRQLTVTGDGTPLVVSYSGREPSDQRYHTLDGRQVPPEEIKSSLPTRGLESPEWARTAQRGRPGYDGLLSFTDARQPATFWYFLHPGTIDGTGYFAGYDSGSKLPVGYLGTAGFRPDVPPAEEQLPVDGRLLASWSAFENGVMRHGFEPYRGTYHYAGESPDALDFAVWIGYVISAGRIVAFDLRTGTTRVVAEVPDAADLCELWMPVAGQYKPDMVGLLQGSRRLLGVRTQDAVLAISPRTGKRETYPLPPELRGAGFDLCFLPDGRLLAIVRKDLADQVQSDLYWMDTAGKILDHRQVLWQRRLDFHERPVSAAWLGVLATPAPVAAIFTVPAGFARQYVDTGQESAYPRALARAAGATWPHLLLVCLIAAAAAWLCYRRQQRYALPGTAAWVAMVFLGGVPGLIGYLVHRRWPPLEACASCGELVPRDRSQCARCGAEFPPPAPKGIEVFAA